MPRQLANRPRAHPPPHTLSRLPHAGVAEYPVLPTVSRGCPGAGGRLPTCYSAVRHSMRAPKGALTVRLACVRRAASVHPEPGSNSPSKYVGPRARPVLSVIADRFRSIHMVLFDRKRNSRGRLSAALRKTNPSQTISNGSMSARMRHIWCVHPRSIRFSRCTPARSIRSDRAARQGDILPDRRGPRGGNLVAHSSYTFIPAADACQSLPTTRRAYLYIDQPHG